MTRDMFCETIQSFAPRLTVARRKEALELRKVRRHSPYALCIFLLNPCALSDLQWMRSKHYTVFFFSDNETFDGKEKARTYQRQPQPSENPHTSPYWQRCKLYDHYCSLFY